MKFENYWFNILYREYIFKYICLRRSFLSCSHCTSFSSSFFSELVEKILRDTENSTDRIASELFFLLLVLPIPRTRRSNAPVSPCASPYATLFFLLSYCRSHFFFERTKQKMKEKEKKRKEKKENRRDGRWHWDCEPWIDTNTYTHIYAIQAHN